MEGLWFVLYDTMCPAVPPGPDNWLPCPNLDHDVYTLDGDCAR